MGKKPLNLQEINSGLRKFRVSFQDPVKHPKSSRDQRNISRQWLEDKITHN